jgi:coenzyme F420-reducing hydrogenase gamma subunit
MVPLKGQNQKLRLEDKMVEGSVPVQEMRAHVHVLLSHFSSLVANGHCLDSGVILKTYR